MSARVKLPPELADLLRSELDMAIQEAAFHMDQAGSECEREAIRRCMNQLDG